MTAAYVEPSAINWLVDSQREPGSVARTLSSAGYRPVVGLHVIYELARTFLNPDRQARGQALFAFVRDLEPSVSPGSSNLMAQEVVKLRTGAAVLPFLDHLNQVATRGEITRLASGVFDSVARGFIERREHEIEENHPKMMQEYIASVQALRRDDVKAVPRFGTFDDAVLFFREKVPSIVRDLLRRQVSTAEAATISDRLDQCPAIRSGVMANLYLMWVCISHRVSPAFDKLDDYRHVIEASYCDAIVAGDDQLLRTVPRIQPGLGAIRAADLFG